MNWDEGRSGARAVDWVFNKYFQEGHTPRHGGKTLHDACKRRAYKPLPHITPDTCTLTLVAVT